VELLGANDSTKLLLGKKALITGAGKGIGRELAIAYASNGARACLVSRTSEDIDLLAKEIWRRFGVESIPIRADVSSRESTRNAVASAVRQLGGIDILVNAAGYPLIRELWESRLHNIDEEDILRVLQIDLLGSFRMAKDILPIMMKQKHGVIILFSSTPALSGYDKGGAYTVAKAANLGLAKELAAEYGRYNVRVYAIAPGNIRTKGTFDQLSKRDQEKLASEAPMRRWGTPKEVADVAVVLASDKMSFVTGQTIVVDGGTTML
jgi:NAD(P)-dependent dehydrogenase (short-subunit alcohol dehydrogenase family)